MIAGKKNPREWFEDKDKEIFQTTDQKVTER